MRAKRYWPRLLAAALGAVLLLVGCAGSPSYPPDPAAPPVRHVFVIMLENVSYRDLYGANPAYPYLANVLRPQGMLMSNFYAIGHWSLGNYLGLLGGVAPTKDIQNDCAYYTDMTDAKPAPLGQVRSKHGCVFPPWVPTLPGQLTAKNLTWKGYMQDMGNKPGREQPTCGQPSLGNLDADQTQKAVSGDSYAARHNPFIYFASVRDTPACHTQVVPLPGLATDLRSAATTPNYAYIAPNLCDDGHNQCPAPQDPNVWLDTWIPRIMASPAYRDGLIIILADESINDSAACCRELSGPNLPYPGGPTKQLMAAHGHGKGGGRIGALLLSPYVTPGGISHIPYNDYSLLRSVENIFGLPHLGYAAQPGLAAFGPDVWHSTTPATTRMAAETTRTAD